MADNWTDAERLAAEVLSSGSDEALRELLAELDRGLPSLTRSHTPSRSSTPHRSRWRGSGFLDVAVDGAVVVVALACIAVGARPVASLADARPAISEALRTASIPSAISDLSVGGQAPGTAATPAVDRTVTAGEPISLLARSLEAMMGRYRAVAAMYAQNKLPCSQLRRSYGEVDDGWTRYSVARSRTYGGEIPDHLIPWDATLYDAVRDVDRDFTASGCNRP